MTVLVRRALVPVLGVGLAVGALALGLLIGSTIRTEQPTAGETALSANPGRASPSPLPSAAPSGGEGGGDDHGAAGADLPGLSRPAAGAPLVRGLHDGEMPHDPEGFVEWWGRLEHPPSLVHWGEGWPDGRPGQFPLAVVRSVHDAGGVPIITWQPRDPAWLEADAGSGDGDGPPVASLEAIAAGEVNQELLAWAQAAAMVDGPVLVRPLPDANGFWFPWGDLRSSDARRRYRAAWRRISEAFDDAGADQVKLVWSVSAGEAFDADQVEDLYPGDEHVDLAATTALRWGETVPWGGTAVDELLDGPLALLQSLGQDVVVFTGVARGADGTREQADLVGEVGDALRGEEPVVGVVWLSDHLEGVDFRLSADAVETALSDRDDGARAGVSEQSR